MALGLACVVSCTDAGTALDGPASRNDGAINASITIPVIGDRSAAPDSFFVTLDGFWWRQIPVGIADKAMVPSGNHTLAVALNPSNVPSWCEVDPAKSYTARFSVNHVESVNLPVTCPALTGTGLFHFSVSASGARIPANLPVKLVRLNGATVIDQFTAAFGTTTDRTLPAGLYQLTYTARNCAVSGVTVTPLGMRYVLRADQEISLGIALRCTDFGPFFP